jgi:ABC-type transport system involved in cytochrome c biogenesis ATPase subunit
MNLSFSREQGDWFHFAGKRGNGKEPILRSVSFELLDPGLHVLGIEPIGR